MIGENLRKHRLKKGITLTELAQRSKVSKSYLNSLERNIKNNPSINLVKRLANELGTDIYQIIGEEKNSENPINEREEWRSFIKNVRDAGIENGELSEYKELIDYIKWKNRKVGG
ncbi:helix-turn-helix transcriptional regulator [Pseudalkalibacillus hwajinpoensis]|uniref:helix-turn-helix domain-containing protein n=1 Tax=Guptibacillus hwajinpoensis TaxID=208199 RepID=UPI00325A941E